MDKKNFDTLVLGAGPAGLGAAAFLRKAGKEVAVIEARDRVGGRVHTVFPADSTLPVELGAEFIHGKPLVLEKYCKEKDASGEKAWKRKGKKILRLAPPYGSIQAVYDSLSIQEPDEAFLSAFERARKSGFWDSESEKLARSFASGFYAAVLEDVSAKFICGSLASVGDSNSEKSYRVRSGYCSVLDPFLQSLAPHDQTLFLNRTVKKIVWSRSCVEVLVQNASGKEENWKAKQIIFTLPVGVWDRIQWEPALTTKDNAMEGLAMGPAHRVVLRFKTPFWENRNFKPGYFYSFQDPFPRFWTARPWEEPRITCWSGGSETKTLTANRVNQAIEALATSLGKGTKNVERQLVSAHYHDWTEDPFAQGAYSYARPEGEKAREVLRKSEENTLFFAGEAYHWGNRTGTVDGAIETGLAAAVQVIGSAA
jgi:monoamine oxidase